MKGLGLGLLTIGVMLSAAFGARLSDPVASEVFGKGRAALASGQADAVREAYCAALGAPSRDEAACGEEPDLDGPAPEGLSPELAKLRADWLGWAQRAARAAEEAAKLPTPGPDVRLRRWFDAYGGPFLLGVLLIVAGAFVVRRAERAGVRAGSVHDAGDVPSDLREGLERLLREVDALQEQMVGGGAEEALKASLDRLRFERIEPLVEARLHYQRQLGLERFARAFGPFSSAERSLYRAWSALVDGVPEEARRAVETARERLREALSELPEGSAPSESR